MKRKIIEIYVEEDKENEVVSYHFERCEDSEVANAAMKGLLKIINNYEDGEYTIEAEYEESE